MSPSQISHAARSVTGPRRPTNEDRFAVCPGLGLYLVTDGVGGEQNGLHAAVTVAEALPSFVAERLSATARGDGADTKRLLVAAVRELHQRCAAEDPIHRSQATLVAVLLQSDRGLVAYLGDSRAYLHRAQTLSRLTKDHTLAQHLVDTGDLEPAELESSPLRSQLIRCIGMPGSPPPELREFEWGAGDQLLLCSDGVTSMLSDVEIGHILDGAASPNEAVDQLVAGAIDRGGHDNITAVVLTVCG